MSDKMNESNDLLNSTTETVHQDPQLLPKKTTTNPPEPELNPGNTEIPTPSACQQPPNPAPRAESKKTSLETVVMNIFTHLKCQIRFYPFLNTTETH